MQDLKNKALAYPFSKNSKFDLKKLDLDLDQLRVEVHVFIGSVLNKDNAKVEFQKYDNFTNFLTKLKSNKDLSLFECKELNEYYEQLKLQNADSKVLIPMSRLINSFLRQPLAQPEGESKPIAAKLFSNPPGGLSIDVPEKSSAVDISKADSAVPAP